MSCVAWKTCDSNLTMRTWKLTYKVYFLELFRQCGIFWNCSDSVVFFGTVPTVGYFSTVPTVWYFWNCSDSVEFRNSSKNTTLLEQFQKYHTVGTVLKIPHCRNSSEKQLTNVSFYKII
jgi:hypothetical protein